MNKTKDLSCSTRSSLRLSTSTPLGALSAKATRAAMIAQLQQDMKVEEAAVRPPRKRRRVLSPIELQLQGIRNTFRGPEFNSVRVEFDKPSRYSAAVTVVNIYNIDTDSNQSEAAATAKPNTLSAKSHKKTKPIRSYVFYPSAIDNQHLGSVSIYGNDLEKEYVSIRRMGHIFGLRVRSLAMEIGMHPYIDVHFRA